MAKKINIKEIKPIVDWDGDTIFLYKGKMYVELDKVIKEIDEWFGNHDTTAQIVKHLKKKGYDKDG